MSIVKMDCCLCARSAGNAANGEVAVAIPQSVQDQEERMNRSALLEVFFASVASGIGTVGFVWATVILLGGFEEKLSQVDFWFITFVSFFQATRIFGGDWNADQNILYGLPNLPLDILSPQGRICKVLMCCLDYCSLHTPKLSCLLLTGKFVCVFAAFLVRLLKFVVLLGTLILSVTRLILGEVGSSAGGANLKSAFNLFYGLAIVQAVVSYMAFSYSHAHRDLVKKMSTDRCGPALRACLGAIGCPSGSLVRDDEHFELYYAHVKKMCKAGRITEAISMTLVSFAVESLSSNEQEARVAGVKILHYLIDREDCKEQTLSAVRGSIDAAESLFKMIASTSQDKRPMEAREGATSFMAKLAGNLRISGIPCATQSICSLLEETRGGQPNGVQGVPGNNGHRNPDTSLTGMEILEQLSRKNCNLAEISSSDELMSKITEFTSKNSDEVPSMSDVDFQKAMNSLSVLRRLAGAIGEQGTMIRQVILRNVFLLSNLREILQGRPNNNQRLQEQILQDRPNNNQSLQEQILQDRPNNNQHLQEQILQDRPNNNQRLQELQILVIEIVDGFALDSESRNHDALPKIITELLNIFCEAPNGAFRSATGEALARLTVESRVNCNAILKAYNFEGLRDMLFNDQEVARRVIAGNIMKNMCTYCEAEPSNQEQYETFMGFVGDNMARVLGTIINQTQNLVGEDMEAFLGLVLQFCKLIPAGEFLVALNGVGSDNFVQKLKSVLDQANGAQPADRCPGIRRFAIEQAIWMMRLEEQLHCIQSFIDCGMRGALEKVQQTDTRAENYKLLSGSIPVQEYEESLSTLVKKALRLIPHVQNGQ